MRTLTRKIDNENYIVRVSKKGFENISATVCLDEGKWYVNYDWSWEYDTKEQAIKVAKQLITNEVENL